MEKNPFFSIIIPTLNEEKYVPHLLSDLKRQTNANFEVLVVDGKSNDKTKQKVLSYDKHLALTFIESPKRNVCSQRNLGARNAKAPWLLFIDADNRLPNFYIQGLRYQIDKNNPYYFTSFMNADSKHSLDKTIAQVINTYLLSQKNTKNPSVLEAMIGVKKSLFSSIGGFEETIEFAEGQDLTKKILNKKYPLHIFKEPKYTCSYRRLRKEGILKVLRNSAYLILAQQTGITLDSTTYQKYYPMLGGDYFKNMRKPSNLIESIMADLMKEHEIPLKLPKDPLKKLADYFRRR